MATQNLTGNVDANGVLWGYKWEPSDVAGMTWAISTSVADYGTNPNGYSDGIAGFASMASLETHIGRIIANFNAVSGLQITQTTTPFDAELLFGIAATVDYHDGRGVHVPWGSNGSAEAVVPYDPAFKPYSYGDTWYTSSILNARPGNFYYAAWLMHEPGHALGLKHGHPSYNPDGSEIKHVAHGVEFPRLPFDHDSQEYSVMTYRRYVGGSTTDGDILADYSTTLMQADIAALQQMYGADFTSAGSRPNDTTYTWDVSTGAMTVQDGSASETMDAHYNNKIFMTIWDGGGNDTYDFSNFQNRTAFKIDLNPGAWTEILDTKINGADNPSTMRADLDAGGTPFAHLARGNIANAQLYTAPDTGITDKRSLIENAVGAFKNDTLIGNEAANRLEGRFGNDTLTGGLGGDKLYGDDLTWKATQIVERSLTLPDQQVMKASVTSPGEVTKASADLRGHIAIGLASSPPFNVAFVVDVSGSMSTNFAGSSVGDVNGDGLANSRLDATIVGFQALNRSMIDAGLSDYVNLGIIPFSTTATLSAPYAPAQDANNNSIYDVDAYLTTLRTRDSTYYDSALNQAITFFNSSPSGRTNIIYFLSDGEHNGNDFNSALGTLRSQYNVTINAVAVGTDATFTFLRQIDSDGVVDVTTTPDQLKASLGKSSISPGDIDRVEIVLNGNVVQTVAPSALTATPLGLDFDFRLDGLNRVEGAHNNVEMRVFSKQGGPALVVPVDITGSNDGNDSISGNDLVAGTPGPSQTNDASNDSLYGGGGDDILDGGAGADRMEGGSDDDTYYVDNAGDIVVEEDLGGNDTVYTSVSYTQPKYVEHIRQTGSANGVALGGNSSANLISANAGNQTLSGFGGNDTLSGGAGADTIGGGAGNDTATYADSSAGVTIRLSEAGAQSGGDAQGDVLNSIENVIGSGFADTLTGSVDANRLEGGAGNDRFALTLGNDTLDGGIGLDSITFETSTSGVTVRLDAVPTQPSQTLTLVSIEGLVGSNFADSLTGTADDNLLNGLGGADTLIGGLGNDTYVIDNVGDVIGENANEGVDLVQSSITTTLGVDLENLTLTGGDIAGTGNAAANIITGSAGNNTLDGGAGADTLAGGLGNDTYGVDSAGDVVIENANEGVDIVNSSVSYSLGANVENLALTGSGNLAAFGNAQNNVLFGNTGDNNLDGGAGADTMYGGIGNDTYTVEVAGDLVSENAGEGIDTVNSFIAYTLGANVENLSIVGSGNLGATGNALNNVIAGNAGINVIDGLGGADTMIGGGGDDYYVVDVAGDMVVEQANDGTDIVVSFVDHTLGANIENLILFGTSVNATGNALANRITGNGNANVVDGRAGADTMIGLAGDDSYIVDDAGDVVIEAAGEGTDRVTASVSHTLSANVENLTLSGTGNFVAGGNALDNTIIGNSGNNVLDGGVGADNMIGGLGDDTYLVDNAGDVVSEAANGGTDTVNSAISYALDAGNNVENLSLVGTADLTGTGNGIANQILGNAGNNTIDGGLGADTLVGGGGNDAYLLDNAGDLVIEQAGEGTDTVTSSVTYTLAANIENLTLTGSASLVAGGNALANVLIGNTGNNVLDGGAGADTMTGGLGNDTYVLDTLADVIVENAGEGTDTVNSFVSYTLGANLENLSLIGTGDLVGGGNALGNLIYGNAGSNTLDGAVGIDTLIGGAGNDTYVVDNVGDVVTETANEGTDWVNSYVTYTLSAHVENLTLFGTGSTAGTGNALNNLIGGNSGNNTLTGGGGADTLDGGFGADSLVGGTGDDLYTVDNIGDTVVEMTGEGIDTVNSFISYTLGANVENLSLIGSGALLGTGNALNNVMFGGTGNNTLDGGAGADTIYGGAGNDTYGIDNAGDLVGENVGEGTDTVNSSITYTLGANFENLTLTGTGNIVAGGNALANMLTGNGGNNVLDGGSGADTMSGGLGDDVYVVDNGGDSVVEAASSGTDTVNSYLSYTLGANVENLSLIGAGDLVAGGNALANVIYGNSGNNVIDGGAGIDTMIGGSGNDTYVVESTGDVVTENAGEGTDTVNSYVGYTLSANVENLSLIGTGNLAATGNALANTLIGNAGDNAIDGGAGADTMIGGGGNDVYVVDNAGDVVIENVGFGIDLVLSSVSFTLGATVENLTLTGTGDIVAGGNAFANVLNGNGGNNILDGGTGADTMAGGAGNDIYVVDDAGDAVTENAGEGVDTVNSYVAYTLGANLETVALLGTANLVGGGNAAANLMFGNVGNNTLDGGAGADTIYGGAGSDTYVVDDGGDAVAENANEGTDTVNAFVSYGLGANIENLTLFGSGHTFAAGNALANILTGNAGNNILDGGAGADTLIGRAGDDTYVLDDAGDVAIENAGEGADTVNSSVSYTLAANLENLTLVGSANLTAGGNALGNVLIGNAGNNVLDGSGGADTMIGGAGDDVYVVDGAGDIVAESSGGGTDTINSYVSYVLVPDVENLSLIGSGNLTGTGNALANTIYGNAGDNTIDGGAGIDTLIGGGGADTYRVESSADVVVEEVGGGIDTIESSVTFALGANVETLILEGSADISGTGSADANTLTGNAGANVLDGGAGADTMIGGRGNDSYLVDNAGDVVTENAGEGVDAVVASISYALGANVENLGLSGTANLSGTGNSLANGIFGNAGANVLDGLGGADSMFGGAGDDTYVVDDAGDAVVEAANEGVDIVTTAISYTLGANVENLAFSGAGNLVGAGNALANLMYGNVGNNIFDGGLGADTMFGGIGDDTYVIDDAGDFAVENADEGVDTINSSITLGLSAHVENLVLLGTADLSGAGNALANVLTGNSGSNVLDGGLGADTMRGGFGNDTYLVDGAGDVVVENAGEGTDSVTASVSWVLGANLENLTLAAGAFSGTGNALANAIFGNSGANAIDGLAGADSMFGGGGDDSYVVDDAGDVVIENAADGTDIVNAYVSFTLGADVENLAFYGTGNLTGGGNALGNLMYGNVGDNIFDGGLGADTMFGGIGNDTYVVDDAGDLVAENASEGTDTVNSFLSAALGANVENLVLLGGADLVGSGNSLANVLTGNAGSNILDGGLGVDTMSGGLGNDTYLVDSAGDVIVENASEGVDSVTATVSYTLAAHVENLTLAGSAFSGTGNALANAIFGNAGANALDGLGGADSMFGGAGDDYYVVDDAGDVVVENSGDGTDIVNAFVSFTLGANVENLAFYGTGDLVGGGNALSNTIYGNVGNNTFDGGLGADTMFGGIGNDTYVVDDAGDLVVEYASEGVDTINSTITLVLSANVENLTLFGTADLSGAGNALANVLIGNGGANSLDGKVGADTLFGLGGDDTFVFRATEANGDRIGDFAGNGVAAGDRMLFFGYGSAADGASLTQVDSTRWSINSADGAIHDIITLTNAAPIHMSDYIFA